MLSCIALCLHAGRPQECPSNLGPDPNVLGGLPLNQLQPDTSIIWVLDPNSHLCWEPVAIDPYTNATLLAWVHGLRDPLTAYSLEPQGRYLQV